MGSPSVSLSPHFSKFSTSWFGFWHIFPNSKTLGLGSKFEYTL
jgi:hypothetical protein